MYDEIIPLKRTNVIELTSLNPVNESIKKENAVVKHETKIASSVCVAGFALNIE